MKRWQIIVGIVLIFFGLISLFETIFQIDLGRFIGPLILIGIGLLLLLRPQMAGPDVDVQMTFLGDIRKTGTWEVNNQEIWSFVGATRLDFTDAIFKDEEKTIKVIGFVKDLRIILPEDVGMRFESTAFVSEIKAPDNKQDRFFGAMEYRTPNYVTAEKQVFIQTIAFVSEITVKSALL
jgi:predicted membrane protein